MKLRSFLLFSILFIAFSAYGMEQDPTTTNIAQQVKIESKNRPFLFLKGITTGVLACMLANHTYLMFGHSRLAQGTIKDPKATDQQKKDRVNWSERFFGIALAESYITYCLSKECIKSWYKFFTMDKQTLTGSSQATT